MDSLFSGERDAHNTTVPLFIHNCSNTLDLESPPKKKTSNPPEAKEPRQHSISGSKCPAKAQAQTALGCCYPEMFCNANVAACLLHRRTKRFMARERKAVPSAADEKGTQKRGPCMAVDRISSAFRDRVLLIFGQGARVGGVGT